MGTSVYDSKNLHAIVRESGLSHEKIAELTGVPVATLTSYLRDDPAIPNLKHLTRLADFFAVPLDFIVGRCDKELADNIIGSYGKYFMELRRAPYEVYLDGRKRAPGTVYDATEGETPWPYNLMGAVLGKQKEFELISEDQEVGIMEALGTLDIRHEGFVLAYYRDGLSLKEIAACHKVSPEWIRQAITKAIRCLRHPSKSKYLIYGKNGVETMDENTATKAELAKQEIELASLRERLWNKHSVLLSLQELISSCGDSVMGYIKSFNDALGALSDDGDARDELYSLSVEELDFPTFIYNCLKRNNYNTLDDIVRLAELGKLLEIIGLGETSAKIILSKIKALTGKDLFKANNVK